MYIYDTHTYTQTPSMLKIFRIPIFAKFSKILQIFGIFEKFQNFQKFQKFIIKSSEPLVNNSVYVTWNKIWRLNASPGTSQQYFLHGGGHAQQRT